MTTYKKHDIDPCKLVKTEEVVSEYDLPSVKAQRDALLVEVARLDVILAEGENKGVKLIVEEVKVIEEK